MLINAEKTVKRSFNELNIKMVTIKRTIKVDKYEVILLRLSYGMSKSHRLMERSTGLTTDNNFTLYSKYVQPILGSASAEVKKVALHKTVTVRVLYV